MNTRRVRQDLDHLNSWALLLVSVTTILTGLIVHLWDLHGFVYHTYSGYAMALLALVHVCLNARRMVGYVRFRLARRPRLAVPAGAAPVAATSRPRRRSAPLVSRRGLIGLALGGTTGFLAGRGLRPPPVLEKGSDLGLVYHEWSKPGPMDAIGSLANVGRQPPPFKSYLGVVRIALPQPDLRAGLPVEEAIRTRRSTRAYAPEPMAPQELSRVLQLTAGMSGTRWSKGLRNHPSSGALYPIEMYPVVHNVEGVEPGVYHYNVQHHELEQVRAGDYRQYVMDHGLSQEFLGQCAAVVYLTMIFQRMRFKYRERSYRYGLIEAGHLGQNLYLAATSLGLGACAVGAYNDEGIDDLLRIDGAEEVSVYLLSLGRVARPAA
jgi:SagB-type dehydrogenase family enzyme